MHLRLQFMCGITPLGPRAPYLDAYEQAMHTLARVSLSCRVACDVCRCEPCLRVVLVLSVRVASQMGLGKTLDSIMLIMTNPATAEWLEQGRHPVGPGQDVVCPIKTTLVVVPGSLVYQWLDELRIHLKSKCMTW